MSEEAMAVGGADISQVQTVSDDIGASFIAEMIGIIRQFLAYVLSLIKNVFTWAGDNPLAFMLMIEDFTLLVA